METPENRLISNAPLRGERLANDLLDALDEMYPEGGDAWYAALDAARHVIVTMGEARQ